MADLIEKIGRFFAEQEAQIQDSYSQAARPAAPVPRPPNVVHKVPFPAASSPLQLPQRSTSFIRKRLSFTSAWNESAADEPQREQETASRPLEQARIAGILSSVDRKLNDDSWSRRLSGGLASWTSSQSSLSTESRSSSSDDHSAPTEKPRKPRPPHQKNRKRKKKTKRSSNQDELDPKELAKLNAQKVEAALARAQERAKRFQQEQLQLARDRERDRQENELRVHEQMVRIEAVRARSFRGSHSSLATTADSSLQSSDSGSHHEAESVWAAESDDLVGSLKHPSAFMADLELQLREKMSLEMRVKESCIEKHRQRERVRLKLHRIAQQNAAQRPKVARLAATKASLEMELAAVLAETADIRQRRREIEDADQKERVRRQREAERELQIRLREEEWLNMMEEEKTRTELAAEARAKANQRVAAHAASLRRIMQAYRYEPQRSTDASVLSSTPSNNNADNDEEHHAPDELRSSNDSKAEPLKMDLFLSPELADFEEDGLRADHRVQATSLEGIREYDDRPEAESGEAGGSACFCWEIPPFGNHEQLAEAIVDMVRDDEDD